MKYRVVIIGAGIVGASIARLLSMYEEFDVKIVEREPDVGWGCSKANTGIIHPGHEEDPKKHPLRARLCVRGNMLWREWAEQLSIPVKWVGELMAFTNDEEEKRSKEFLKLAVENGVSGVRVLYDEEVRKLEPNISPLVKGAIYAPTAGVISPFEAVIAIIENAVENGAKLITETVVKKVVVSGGVVKGVETSNGFIEADIVVNAAGINADEISHTAGVEKFFRITPRRGQYILFSEDVPVKPRMILHTVPTLKTKGVYAVTTVHGNLMIGPTAEDLAYDDKENVSTTEVGLSYLLEESSKLLKEVPKRSAIIRTFAGVRPEPPDGNWLIKAYEDPWGFVNVAGIRSPGLTAAPAIAEYVLNLVVEKYGVRLTQKKGWNPHRNDITRVRHLNLEELDRLIVREPSYGEIVCYCKMVSRAEIVEAIERMKKIGLKTITFDGLKFRVYVGFGKCQGSFCRLRVAKIISERTGTPLEKVVIRRDSYGLGDVKMLWKAKTTQDQSVI